MAQGKERQAGRGKAKERWAEAKSKRQAGARAGEADRGKEREWQAGAKRGSGRKEQEGAAGRSKERDRQAGEAGRGKRAGRRHHSPVAHTGRSTTRRVQAQP